MGDVSEETLLDYFCSSGGSAFRVRNADILKTFKPFIGHSDPLLRAKYREEFKLIIDRIAVVKSENGEKYLVLKKKYRQMLHERDTKPHGDGQRQSVPDRTLASAQSDATDSNQRERRGEVMSCGAAEDLQTGTASMQNSAPQRPVIPILGPSVQSNCEDELDKDSGSKSESEQDEESTGSMGSAAVALDPLEKEWIHSAAGARVPDLSQLLTQDPSLANKKTALHWAAKHGREDMASLVADAGADVNTKSHVSTLVRRRKRWGYTPLHIAALHGHRHILDLLVGSYGAKENLRDYSGHLAFHYLNSKEPEVLEEDCELPFQITQARERNRNRKLVSLFHSKKKWGSAEDLAPIEEERTPSHQLALPPFRARKFSR